MDPTATLALLRSLAEEITRGEDLEKVLEGGFDPHAIALAGKAVEFVSTFQALDKWLSNRGFLPRDWQEGH